jgi:hypothetical protein
MGRTSRAETERRDCGGTQLRCSRHWAAIRLAMVMRVSARSWAAARAAVTISEGAVSGVPLWKGGSGAYCI